MHSLLRGWGKGVLSFMCKEYRGEVPAGPALPASCHQSIFGYPSGPQPSFAKLLECFSFHFADVVFYVA